MPLELDELVIPRFQITKVEDNPPRDKLATPSELFERINKERERLESSAGGIIEILEDKKVSFAQLDDLRKNFTHLSPRGWTIGFHDIENIFTDVVNIIQRIRSDPWPFRHMEEPDLVELDILLSQVLQLARNTVSQIATSSD